MMEDVKTDKVPGKIWIFVGFAHAGWLQRQNSNFIVSHRQARQRNRSPMYGSSSVHSLAAKSEDSARSRPFRMQRFGSERIMRMTFGQLELMAVGIADPRAEAHPI